MEYGSNGAVDTNALRLEIATLMDPIYPDNKEVPLKNPIVGRFKINVVNTTGERTTVTSSGSNIKNNMPSKSGKMNLIDTVGIPIPMCFRVFFNKDKKIPKGTKFIVAFVGGDTNNPKIVGLYDDEVCSDFEYSYWEFQVAFKKLVKRVRALENIHGYDGGEL